MPHKTVKCPNYARCHNYKQPDAELCQACRYEARRASKVARPVAHHAADPNRYICPGLPDRPCGGRKSDGAELCQVCRTEKRVRSRASLPPRAPMPPPNPNRYVCPGLPDRPCGGRKSDDAEICAACRRLKGQLESEARRMAEAEAAERLATNQPTTEDQLRDDNARLRGQVRQLEVAVASHRDRARVEDRLVENVRGYIEANPYRPQLRPTRELKIDGQAKPHEMVVVVSDAHYPERVDPAAAYGIEYNGDICLRRLERVRDVVVRYRDLRATSYPVQKITIAVNGDMLSGNIHEELEVTNEQPIGEAMVHMSYALFDLGKDLAATVPNVEMVIMPGNHPRLERKPRMKNAWNNWEWVMGMFVQALARDAFTVIVPKDLVYQHRVFDQVIGLTHGDGVKAQAFAGIPWYSMKQRRDAMQSLLKSLGLPQLDFLVYGHFHQLIFEEGSGSSLLINGSIKGYDEYLLKTKYSGQTPVQALLTFHPEHGMTDLSRINLGDVR